MRPVREGLGRIWTPPLILIALGLAYSIAALTEFKVCDVLGVQTRGQIQTDNGNGSSVCTSGGWLDAKTEAQLHCTEKANKSQAEGGAIK